MEHLLTTESAIAFATLVLLEIVLGIDNIIFITILTGRLPQAERGKARNIGLLLAMGMRIALLFAISWVMGLKETLFTLMDHPFNGRDLILLGGGLFLVAKATYEIHHKMEEAELDQKQLEAKAASGSFKAILIQIILLDIVFSLDSVITAVGMVKHIEIMMAAVIVSVGVMLFFAKPVGEFVEKHPTMKMLALSFLLLIGVMLVAEGCGSHVEKGYVYFALGFSLFVEFINLRIATKRKRAQQGLAHA